jgi:hypothetical protein
LKIGLIFFFPEISPDIARQRADIFEKGMRSPIENCRKASVVNMIFFLSDTHSLLSK